jgi:hypothetical protein
LVIANESHRKHKDENLKQGMLVKGAAPSMWNLHSRGGQKNTDLERGEPTCSVRGEEPEERTLEASKEHRVTSAPKSFAESSLTTPTIGPPEEKGQCHLSLPPLAEL